MMCTVMQKDVLIELVAHAQATLAKRLPLPLNDDQKTLAKLRGEIYSTPHYALDYENLCQVVNGIKDKYQNLPKL